MSKHRAHWGAVAYNLIMEQGQEKKPGFEQWGLAALPICVVTCAFIGAAFGNMLIGFLIGAALGIGAAVFVIAASAVLRTLDR